MFTLGCVAGTFTEQNVLKMGFTMAAHGLLAAYSAFAIGYCMEGGYLPIGGLSDVLSPKADL
jgi:hypothetical protein